MFNKLKEYEREMEEEDRKYREKLEKNPLLQYSTSELKAELRRRKRKNG